MNVSPYKIFSTFSFKVPDYRNFLGSNMRTRKCSLLKDFVGEEQFFEDHPMKNLLGVLFSLRSNSSCQHTSEFMCFLDLWKKTALFILVPFF